MITHQIYTDRELALNNLNFCVPVLTSFHAPRKLLWQVSFVVFSVKSIGKTPFESTKMNIFAKFLHRSSFCMYVDISVEFAFDSCVEISKFP